MRLLRIKRRDRFNRGSKQELERSNAIDAELGLLTWDEFENVWRPSHPRRNRAEMLVIGERDVASECIFSLKDAQLKRLGVTDQAETDYPTKDADKSSVFGMAATQSYDAKQCNNRRLTAQRAFADLSELWDPITQPPCLERGPINDVDSIAFASLLSSIIRDSPSRLNPEDVLADSTSDTVRHRTSVSGVSTLFVPYYIDDFGYNFHILGHLDPTYHPIAKFFDDIRNAMFILDFAKLETSDSRSGMPYITAQLDLFSRCVTLPTCFARKRLKLFLLMINYDSITSTLDAHDTTAYAFLSRVDPDFHSSDLKELPESLPAHKAVLQYFCHRFEELISRANSLQVLLCTRVVSSTMDERSVGLYLPAIHDVVCPQAFFWGRTISW